MSNWEDIRELENQLANERAVGKVRTLFSVGAVILGTLICSDLYNGIEHGAEQLEKTSGRIVNRFVPPQVYDVNEDGIKDIVLQRNNGKDLVLYGTREGTYIFGEEEK